MRVLFVSLAVFLCACAPQATTIPKLSVGNTGCSRGELAVFNYVPDQRSWTAVCQQTVYACSSVGGGASRCTPAPDGLQSEEVLRRANVVRSLSPDRADTLLTHDVVGMDRDFFIQTVALLSVFPVDLVAKIDDPTAVVLLDPQSRESAGCALPTLFRIALDDSGKPHEATGEGACRARAAGSLTFDKAFHGHYVQIFTGVTSEGFQREFERVRAIYEQPITGTTAAASAANAGAGAEVMGRVAGTAESALAAADEAIVRAKLDAIGPDWLACLGADRSVAIASVDPSGRVSVRARELDAADPVQGCVRALFGEVSVSSGPGEIVHLVRAPSQRSPAGTSAPSGVADPEAH